MALITVSGEPGCRTEEVARIAAQQLHFDLITEKRLHTMMEAEFGARHGIPDRAYPPLVASIIARLAMDHHLVLTMPAAELLVRALPGLLRVRITAAASRRVGSLMVDNKLERPFAMDLLSELEEYERAERRRRFGRSSSKQEDFDLVFNAASMESDQMALLIGTAVSSLGLVEQGLLSQGAEAQLQFQFRLQLAKDGMSPPGQLKLKKIAFGHPSEQIFANLLDFYRIAWEYEPHSFPIQWDQDGKALEAFTPDFYLPEFDLYVELTTMKQSHVTKKNRKVKLLRSIYPHVNIQVFYQKDFQNLIFKYGLGERVMQA
jgi:cytidylate kinase